MISTLLGRFRALGHALSQEKLSAGGLWPQLHYAAALGDAELVRTLLEAPRHSSWPRITRQMQMLMLAPAAKRPVGLISVLVCGV